MPEKTNGKAAAQKGPAPGIDKMEAVRRALKALGDKALPTEIQKYVKEQFGIEMKTDIISPYKGDIRRKKAAKSKAAQKQPTATKEAARATAAEAEARPAAAPRSNGRAGGINLEVI